MARLVLLVATGLALVLSTTGCATLKGLPGYSVLIGTSDYSEARQELAELRALLLPPTDAPESHVPAQDVTRQEIDLEIHVLSVCVTDTSTPLFWEGTGDKLCTGRLKSRDARAFACALDDVSGVQLNRAPGGRVSCGKTLSIPAWLCTGAIGGCLRGTWLFSPSALSLEITPTVVDDGGLMLDIGVALWRLKLDSVSRVMRPARANEEPDAPEKEVTVRGRTRTRLAPGESLVLGGLRHTRLRDGVGLWWLAEVSQATPTSRKSALRDLPGIGHWFAEHKELVEEEFVVVITPRVLAPRAMLSVQASP